MPYVLTEVRDGVAVVTLNDPERRNAINLDMNAELAATFDEMEAGDVGAVVLTGAAPAFCAGAALDLLRNAEDADALRRIYSGFLRIADSPLPTIAAVNGAAVGAGMNMALACDMVLAGESARFDTRFLQIGIHPGGGHLWRLRRLTNHQTLNAMVLFADTVDGHRAEAVGLAWQCVRDDQLLDTAVEFAGRAAAAPRELVRRIKSTISQLDAVDTADSALELELEPQRWSVARPEFKQLVARLEKRLSAR